MADPTRTDIERLLVGRTVAEIVWEDEPIYASPSRRIARCETDLAALALVLDDGTRVDLMSSDQLDSSDVWLEVSSPQAAG